CLQGYSAPWTF
nr:immunoglobulin light chain junction region [Macaca mulatta]